MGYRNWIAAAAVGALAACGSEEVTAPVANGQPGQVSVGNDFFRSDHNGTQNPAVDTVAIGTTVTWRWKTAGSHSLQSTGLPPEVFRNSVVMSGANSSYSITFRKAGTYPYQCAVHGEAMSGRIVVQ